LPSVASSQRTAGGATNDAPSKQRPATRNHVGESVPTTPGLSRPPLRTWESRICATQPGQSDGHPMDGGWPVGDPFRRVPGVSSRCAPCDSGRDRHRRVPPPQPRLHRVRAGMCPASESARQEAKLQGHAWTGRLTAGRSPCHGQGAAAFARGDKFGPIIRGEGALD
jgi:hypothetical protein